MENFWFMIGGSVVSGLVGALTAAVILLVGGLGALTALKKSLVSLQDGHEVLENRVTREIKTRAALKAVEVRGEARSIEEEARVRLSIVGPPERSSRPSILNLIRR